MSHFFSDCLEVEGRGRSHCLSLNAVISSLLRLASRSGRTVVEAPRFQLASWSGGTIVVASCLMRVGSRSGGTVVEASCPSFLIPRVAMRACQTDSSSSPTSFQGPMLVWQWV